MLKAEEMGSWEMTAKSYRVFMEDNKNVLKFIVMMDMQLYKYTKNMELYTLNESIVWYVNISP